MVRISEPYEWTHFKQDFISKNNNKKPQKFSNEPLLAFVNSVMNIEFVYQILLGTKYFLESNDQRSSSLGDLKNQNRTKLRIQNNGKETSITFCDLKFKDISKWDID